MLQVITLPGVPAPDGTGSGRRQLADWLASRDNPLTARVFVNRMWLHLFGRGLVSTPDDFGVNGSRPSHPELLDYLACRFMEQGWSVKKLIREILLSRAYRLSTDGDPTNLQRDPEDVYLWRMRPRRLEAEVFRDAILSLSGQLVRTPPERPFLARFNPWREPELQSFKPILTPEGIDDPHRSVYLPVVRGTLPELFSLFDFAAPDRPVAQRDASTVPAQALYLLNSPWVIGQARLTARRLLGEPGLDDAGRVERLYRLAFVRRPTSAEAGRALEYVNAPEALLPDPKAKGQPSADLLREERWTSFCQSVIASAEFRTLR
jgi:hypothetical protein